jgi:chaperonin GroES
MIILKLLGARLLVRPEFTKDMSEGGIVYPGSMKERTQEAVVLATGPGNRLKDGKLYSCCVKVGERILYGRMAGVDVEHNEEKLVIIRDEDIVAVIKERGKRG